MIRSIGIRLDLKCIYVPINKECSAKKFLFTYIAPKHANNFIGSCKSVCTYMNDLMYSLIEQDLFIEKCFKVILWMKRVRSKIKD